jgi:hypothetical protein
MKKLITILAISVITMSFSISNAQEEKPDPQKLSTLEGVLWYCSDELAKDLEDQKLYDMASLAVAIALGDAIQNQQIKLVEAARIATNVKYSGKVGDTKIDQESCEKLRQGVAVAAMIKASELQGIQGWDTKKVAALTGALRYCAGKVAENLDEQKLYDDASLALATELQKAINAGAVTKNEIYAVSMPVKFSGKLGDVELDKQRCETLRQGVVNWKYTEAK